MADSKLQGVPFFWKQCGVWAPTERHMATHLFHIDGRLIPYADSVLPYGSNRKDDLIDRGHPGWIRIRRWDKRTAEMYWPEEVKLRQWPKPQDPTEYETRQP
jgi:hypothetical protein